MKMAKSGHFCIQLDTPMPRRRHFRLSDPEPKFAEFSSPPRRSNASPKRTCKSCLGSSLPLILTIFHWTNDDHNK